MTTKPFSVGLWFLLTSAHALGGCESSDSHTDPGGLPDASLPLGDAATLEAEASDLGDVNLRPETDAKPQSLDGNSNRCDPNILLPHCSEDGLEIVSCTNGRVSRGPCASGTTCREDSGHLPQCSREDLACSRKSFVSRCNGQVAETCYERAGQAGTILSTDCALYGGECHVLDGEAMCPGRDPSPCQMSEELSAYCVTDTSIRRCVHPIVSYVWTTTDCPLGTQCVPPRPGITAVCLPTSVELCDPTTFIPNCKPPACANCGSTTQNCTSVGFLLPQVECKPGYACSVNKPEGALAYVASCHQPGSSTCGSTYRAWCDETDNSAVQCQGGYVERTPCGDSALSRCEVASDSYAFCQPNR